MKQVNLFMLTLFLTCSLYSQEPGQWKVLKTGAGGWITGLDIHPSGSIMYARSDVGGAYRYDHTTQRWTQVVTASSIPSEDIAWDRYQGVQSIVSDPTDDDRAYMAYDQNIYFSQDQGDTWQKTNFPEQELRANDDGSKLAGERLAIDPANGQVVYYGSIEEGLYRTLDGQNWTKITAVPQGLEGRGVRSILFDSNGGMVAGRTARIYVVVDGVGVMRSNDGGTTWSNIVDNQFFTFGMPLIYDAEIDAQGRLYICGEDLDDKGDADPFNDDYLNIGVLRFSDDNWTQILLPNIAMGEIATDPFDPDRLMVFSEGFTDTYRTNNSTSPSPTWTFMSYDISAPNIPWLDSDANNWFTLGEIIFDPIQEDRIWISHGTGVYYADNLNADNYTWTEESIDQEHLVSNDVVALSNGDVITAHWDFPMFLHEDVDTYPSEIKPRDRFNDVWDIAQSASDEDFLVAIVEDKRFCCFDDGYARNSSFSEDGGETWTPFASMPESPTTMIFGMSAVSTGDNNNIVWLPAGNRMPYYTLDKGDTWTQVVLPGASPNCCIDQIFFKRKVLVADQVLPHTFYIYDWGEGHIFKSMDGGVSWIKYSEVLGVFSFHAKLASVPDRAGHLLFANGPEQSRSLIEPLSISEDGGQTWTQFDNTDEVINVAVGKQEEGSTYPTIFIHGIVDSKEGYHMSTNKGDSWTYLGDDPLGIYDWPSVMEADKDVFGKFYVGFPGNGFVIHELQDQKPHVLLDESSIELLYNDDTTYFMLEGSLASYQIELLDDQGQLIEDISSSENQVIVDLMGGAQNLSSIRVTNNTNQALLAQLLLY